MFDLLTTDPRSKARRGRLTTAHGVIETPAFIPVGTQASVKAVSPRELGELEAQIILGNTYHLFVRPDIAMVLDECAPYPCAYDYAARSAEMTARWAARCKRVVEVNASPARTVSPANLTAAAGTAATTADKLLFGIVQGATFDDLRKSSAQAVVDLDFDGYAIGGVSVGEPEEEMMRAVESAEPCLPK